MTTQPTQPATTATATPAPQPAQPHLQKAAHEPGHERFDWRIFLRPAVISVFALVILWNFAMSSETLARFIEGPGPVLETVREFRDINLHLQMRLYQLLFRYAQPVHLSTDDVRLVYIGDDTHWKTYYGADPTNRQLLANLITNASQTLTHAAVIGLDVELFATPSPADQHRDQKERLADDKSLVDAIRFAASQGVPVVLAAVYYRPKAGEDRNILIPNIIASEKDLIPPGKDCTHAACATFGFINLPVDKRLVPLAKEVATSPEATPQRMESFAQALAEAYRQPIAEHRNRIPADSTPEDDDRTFGSFLPENKYLPDPEYQKTFLTRLNVGADDAKNQCAGKIVLIGGHWRELEGHGNPVDQHLSPAGLISGMGLHANYVETLLQTKYAHEWPTLVDIVIDIIFGLAVYALFEVVAHTWWKIALLLLGVSFLPLVAAYFSLVNLHVYLDFVLPLELYSLHILYELIYEAVKGHLKGHPAQPASSP